MSLPQHRQDQPRRPPDWIDDEIEALVETVTEATSQVQRADGQNQARRLLPEIVVSGPRRLRQALRERRLEIVVYGLSVLLSVSIAYLLVLVFGR
jgi:hypothetical protein